MIGNRLSHYRIIQQIGAGAMGVVYLARDERLERDVAIKVLPLGTLRDESARKRFRQEALTLSRLNHPNIAIIFDFDSEGGTDFLVTEYVAGVTLDAKLSSGALPWKEVVGLGIQLAQGLAAAHAEGVVHRDLKPANLRLTTDGRLKILDFGLALLVHPEEDVARTISLTSSQQITGTLPYMAPEQLRGEAVDARSDVWAAGAVLYEMATGRRPFPETNGPLLIDAILNRQPEPPSAINPQIKPGLESIILRSLNKNLAERYQSSRELAADLERITTGVAPLAYRNARRWRPWIVGAGTVIILLGVLIGYFGSRVRHAPTTPPTEAPTAAAVNVRRSVAVFGFKNLSGRPDTAWLSTALAEMLTTELAVGEKLLTISGENVARVRSDLALPETDTLAPDTLARVRKNLGSDFVVLGSYLDIGSGSAEDQIRVDLRLQDAIAGQTVAAVSEKGTLAQIDELITRAGIQLRDKLGAGGIAASEEIAAKATMPSNLQATRLYSEGLEKLRSYDELAARGLLVKAVAADPKHAPTRSALAAAWGALGYDLKAREAAKQAFDLSSSLPREERLQVEAQYREAAQQWDESITAYRTLFQLEPDNLDYGLNLARALMSSGKSNDALTLIASLRKLPAPYRDDLRIDLAESRAAHLLSDFKHELELARSVADKAEKQNARLIVGRARQAECSAQRNLGDPKAAIAACEEARKIFQAAGDRFGVAISLNNVGNALYDMGDLPGARKIYEDALRINREIGNQRGMAGALDNIASVAGDQGDSKTAKKLSQQALTIYRETGDRINIAATLNNIAAELVLEGNLVDSEKAFEEALSIGREIGSETAIATALTNIGDVRLELGDLPGSKNAYLESLELFQKNAEKGKSANPILGLGDVYSAAGDLANAQTQYGQVLAITKESGEKHLAAMALSGLGKISLRQDDLRAARTKFQDALNLRTELGEKDAMKDSQLDLALLDLEEGHAGDAELPLRRLLEDLHNQKMTDQEGIGRALLAESLAQQSKIAEAQKQIAMAKTISAKMQRVASRLTIQLAAARVLVAAPSPPNLKNAAEIAHALAAQSDRLGLKDYRLESTLLLAEIEMKSGNHNEARSRLAALEKDARAQHYLLVARKSAAAAGSR